MTKDISYSEYYKKKMDNQFKTIHKSPEIRPIIKPLPTPIHNIHNHNREQTINKLILLVLVALFLLSFITLMLFLPRSNVSFIIISVFGILALFITLTLLHKLYEKSLITAHPALLVFIVYLLLIINMFLGLNYYSIEWAFLGFIVATVIIYDSSIDSRFLILPALLLLGYIPFLLIGKYNAIAENIAIYVYYFLVCGVVLQVVEHMRKIEPKVSFDHFMKGMVKEFDWVKACIIIGIISIGAIIANRFYEIQLLKWTTVYLFLVFLIIYLISNIGEKEKHI